MPYFDATDPADRNNLQVTGNLTWYRGTESLGSHNVKVGFERYTSTLTGGNSQSSTGYVFDADYKVDENGDPVLVDPGALQRPDRGPACHHRWHAMHDV